MELIHCLYISRPHKDAEGLRAEAVRESNEPQGAIRAGVSRRDFLRLTAAFGVTSALGGMGILSSLGYVKGPQEPRPEWENEPGVVDYSLVPALDDLVKPGPYVLRIAQWYDYWPGSFLQDFRSHMRDKYGLQVETTWDVYTSNEELFNWITLGKRRYDVIFPSNYLVDLLKKANMIYTLNEAWLPNLGDGFSNMMRGLVNVPSDNPYDRRGSNGPWVSVPYFWGTTGLGFRTDKLPVAEVKELGYDLFWMDSYQPRAPGYGRVELRKKMRMLDDERDVIGAGLKKAGWEWQRNLNLGPAYPNGYFAGTTDPSGNPGYQWTTNETDPARIRAAGEWLFDMKPRLFDFNSTDQSTSLIANVAILNQAWSGDMMYAIRPDQNTPQPMQYVIPPQGSTWWVDCASIHSKSRNLAIAHAFLDFIHDLDQNLRLTYWNLYSTPNQATFDSLKPFQNDYDMRTDGRLYPNINAPEDFRICDLSQDVGLDTMLNVYNPLWFDLTTD